MRKAEILRLLAVNPPVQPVILPGGGVVEIPSLEKKIQEYLGGKLPDVSALHISLETWSSHPISDAQFRVTSGVQSEAFPLQSRSPNLLP